MGKKSKTKKSTDRANAEKVRRQHVRQRVLDLRDLLPPTEGPHRRPIQTEDPGIGQRHEHEANVELHRRVPRRSGKGYREEVGSFALPNLVVTRSHHIKPCTSRSSSFGEFESENAPEWVLCQAYASLLIYQWLR